MNKQILIPDAVKREMNKTFQLSENALNRALQYKVNSSKARMIRAAALERGGLIYLDKPMPIGNAPVWSTIFDHDKGRIVQDFDKGLQLTLSTETGVGILTLNGEEIARFEDVTTKKWSHLVANVQLIHNRLNF